MIHVEEHLKKNAEACKPRTDSSTESDLERENADRKVSDEHKSTPIDQVQGY